jgi:hypothetical protein
MTNRYVEVEKRLSRRGLPLAPTGGAPAVAMARSLPRRRTCCALGQWHMPGLSGALDPTALAGHRSGSGGGATGYVYTAASGLIDLGHLRDMADMVKFVDDELAGGATTLSLYEGDVVVTGGIPSDAAARLELAAAITYVESWAHELATWDDFSSFSPEDIVSNICGVEVGKRAIAAGGSFDAAVDAALDQLLNVELGARPVADTNAALARIENDWFKVGIGGITLLRRNFEGVAWEAGMPFDAAQSIAWLSPLVFQPQYGAFTYAMNHRVNGASVSLKDMQATTNALRTAWLAAHPGMDRPR